MHSLGLATDLYQLTMMAGYYTAGLTANATFELYVRQLPERRSFLIAAGLEQALEFLEQVRFADEDIEHVRRLPALQHVRPDFFDQFLRHLRFTGEVWAVEEGTPVFPPAPLLRVTAPLPEAQLVETALLAHIGFQTSVASRAARVVEAAAGRPVAEFGARRAHGVDAGVLAGRAAFLGGCASTSNVEAGRRFGIPVSGTMAHSWVTAFPDELEAFRCYSEIFADHAVILLDTYDSIAAARSVVASGLRPRAVRLDSGNLIALSKTVRAILDEGGLRETRIVASGDLNEWRIDEIVRAGAPVDAFGVGAALSTSSDVPSLGAIYKLVDIERGGTVVPVMKRSPEKATYPGRKQVWRVVDRGGAVEDVIELAEIPFQRDQTKSPGVEARPLLKRVMSNGRREQPSPAVGELRDRSRAALAEIPAAVRRLENPETYPIRLGPKLEEVIVRIR